MTGDVPAELLEIEHRVKIIESTMAQIENLQGGVDGVSEFLKDLDLLKFDKDQQEKGLKEEIKK